MSGGLMYSSGYSAGLEAQQDAQVGLRRDNTKVDLLFNPASESRTSILDIKNRNSSPRSPKPLGRSDGYRNRLCEGVGTVPLEAGLEGLAEARPKRKPITKRQRSTRAHHVHPLQSMVNDTVSNAANLPNLRSRHPPAVPAVAEQDALSGNKTQATETSAKLRSSDGLLVKKAAPHTDLEQANTVSDTAVVPRSHLVKKSKFAGRYNKHSMQETGLLQPAVDSTKSGGRPGPSKQRKKQGTWPQDNTEHSQERNTLASIELSGTNIEDVAGNDENVQDPIATNLAETQIASAPDGEIKAGSTANFVSESPKDQANPVMGKRMSDSVWRRWKRKKKVHEKGKTGLVNEVLAGLNHSPPPHSSLTIIHNNNQSHRNHSRTTTKHSTKLSAQAKHLQHQGSMSIPGSTRGHGISHREGREYRKSLNNQALPDESVQVFQSQRTPSIASNRRHRGFQPDEVNKNKAKLGPGDPSTNQGGGNTENLTDSDTTKKLASTMTLGSSEELPPHRRTQVKNQDFSHQPSIHTQVATMDASRPELDPVHFDGVSKPIGSETSSVQIITERQPSCWSIASPPEAPPTDWNSAAANIDRPGTTILPVYRFPRPGQKAERETASSSFTRQTQLKTQVSGSMSKPQKPHHMNKSPPLAIPAKGEAKSVSHAVDALRHQFQQLQDDGRLDPEQASKVRAIQEEVLAKNMQNSSEIQLESDGLKASSPIEDTSQAKLVDVKETQVALSAVSAQVKIDQVSTASEQQSGAVPPHLRVQPARAGSDNKNKPLPPHLRRSASPPTTITVKATARDEDLEPGKQTIPAGAETRATKGPSSVTTPSLASQKQDDSYRPTIDVDEEIAATQPVLDIDEEIVAGLRAETSCTFPVAQPATSDAQETKQQPFYVVPHLRASHSKPKAHAAESKSKGINKDGKTQADRQGDRTHNTNTMSNSFTVGTYAGALQEVTSKRKNANLASPSKNGLVPNGVESAVKKGKQPARELESVDFTSELGDWEGKLKPPPVGDEWNRRRPFHSRSHERHLVIEAWREENAADPEENNRVVVNTTSANFQTGEGLAGGEVDVLSPIDKTEHEAHTCNDEFTQARRHQNAAEAMKDYEAKIAAKPKAIPSGTEGMTKEERRTLRRALINEDRTRVILPNPHAPAANIYLRPAEFKDMGQVMKIYNYYVHETIFVLHLNPVDELYWRNRLQEAEDERNPFVVAIHMGERSYHHQGDVIRRKQENVVGFAVAADFGSKQSIYRFSVELELLVHPNFHRQGIGRTLFDRILAALSPDHNLLECAPFLHHNNIEHWHGGGSRQAKAIMVNILYSDGMEDAVKWREQWLAKYEFQHVGTLPHVGFKKGKLVHMCQLMLNTSARH